MTALISLLVIAFLVGLGFILGRNNGIREGREKGIAEEAARWKQKDEWEVRKGERHE
jgi:hypothetical protein